MFNITTTNRQVKHFTTPIAPECSMSPSMTATESQIAVFISTSVVGELQYFNQKSTEVSLVILRNTKSYNRYLSLDLR